MHQENTKGARVIFGDSYKEVAELPENSIDSIVCDPPYMIGFMGKAFDTPKDNIAADPEFWKLCLRVLKPGGHLLSFGGSRTEHRMVCAIEDAGFEIRDKICWAHGQGLCWDWHCAQTSSRIYLYGSQATF